MNKTPTPKQDGMSEDELRQFIAAEVRDALDYTDGEIAARREKNYGYYIGDMSNLPTQRGQSQVIDSTVADQINLILPSLLRIFTSGPRVFEYDPAPGVDEDLVNTVTDFVNEIVIRKDNRGENMLWQWAFDALVNIVGVLKVWWEEDIEIVTEDYEGLTTEQFVQAGIRTEAAEDEEIVAVTENQSSDGGDVNVTFDITVQKTINRSKVCIEPIPPEEFVISRDARSMEGAVLKSHRTFERVGDLISQGLDPDFAASLPDYVEHDFADERLSLLRNTDRPRLDSTDPMMRQVAVHQGIIKCDYDGTGIRDWYFKAAGNEETVRVFEIEPHDCQMFFVDFCPIPLPHIFYGRCPADALTENQEVSTVLQRQMLDNLYLTNRPKLEVVTSKLEKGSMDAVLSYAAGQPVGVKQAGAIAPLTVPFVGQHALTGLQYYNNLAERRSGVSRGSMGLNPEALANQSATAANIAYDASQGKIEQFARIWAHGGMRKLGRAILKSLIKYQDFSRVVRLRGEEQKIDPREWGSLTEIDVNVSTGLGSGTKERDLQGLSLIAAKQEQVFAQYGPENPAVKVNQIVNTYRDMAVCMGFDADKYFTEVPADFQIPAQQPPPDPKMIEVQGKLQQGQQRIQLEAQKIQQDGMLDAATVMIKARELAMKEAELLKDTGQSVDESKIINLALKYEDMLRKDQRERDKMEMSHSLKADELIAEIGLEEMAIRAKAPSGNGIIPN